MGWFITKTEKGITFSREMPKKYVSYVELIDKTPDDILYGLGPNFENIMKIAEGTKDLSTTYIKSYYNKEKEVKK